MKLFKSRLCLLLGFVLLTHTATYASNTVSPQTKFSALDYRNIIKVKVITPIIRNIEYKISSKDFKTTEEMNNLMILSGNLYKIMSKDFPKDVSPTAYLEKLNTVQKNTPVENTVNKENATNNTNSHKSSGGGSSSNNNHQIADTFSKKLILSGLDVINEELSMATTSDSILKLNNMKDIFNELFDDCKNDNITFPREYTKEEIIEIVNRLNEETRKATNSSLKTTDIYSYNAQPLAKKGYGRRPIFGGYLTDICMAKSPLDGKEYPYIYTLISFSNFDDIGFYGGKIDLEIWVDGVKVTQKTPQHYGWDGDKSVNFGFNLVAKPISLYEQFGDFDVNETHRVDLKTTVLGDYSFDVCGVKNPAIKYFTNNGKDMIDYVKDTRYLVFDEDMVFPKTTDSIIDIPSTTESIYTLR